MSKWQVGDKIADRYEIHKALAGGMGIVYICYDNRSERVTALKTYRERFLYSEETRKLFEAEALAWIKLEKHPYIVKADLIKDYGGKLFIHLEYITPNPLGKNTLTHYLDGLSYTDILRLSIQFCYGMEYAYSKGIDCHRDIKPDNIMITPDKTVKITDFGLAKAFQEIQLKEEVISVEQNPSLSIFQSKGKQICGTLPYMAPEQFDGYADKRSDIYSFGITLYQMVTNGRLPFTGRSQQEYEKLHKEGTFKPVSSPLGAIIQKCLEKKLIKRYQNFSQMRSNLQALLSRESGEIIGLPKIEKLEEWELCNQGFGLFVLGKYRDAIACYDEALKTNPGDAQTWNFKGICLFSSGKPQEAIECYRKAIEINPRYDNAWFNKGVAFAAMGEREKALGDFDQVLNLNSQNPTIWESKGFVLFEEHRYQEAVNCFDEAISKGSCNARNRAQKALSLYYLGRYQEALACANEAIELDPGFEVARQLKQVILQKLRELYESGR